MTIYNISSKITRTRHPIKLCAKHSPSNFRPKSNSAVTNLSFSPKKCSFHSITPTVNTNCLLVIY